MAGRVMILLALACAAAGTAKLISLSPQAEADALASWWAPSPEDDASANQMWRQYWAFRRVLDQTVRDLEEERRSLGDAAAHLETYATEHWPRYLRMLDVLMPGATPQQKIARSLVLHFEKRGEDMTDTAEQHQLQETIQRLRLEYERLYPSAVQTL